MSLFFKFINLIPDLMTSDMHWFLVRYWTRCTSELGVISLFTGPVLIFIYKFITGLHQSVVSFFALMRRMTLALTLFNTGRCTSELGVRRYYLWVLPSLSVNASMDACLDIIFDRALHQ